MKKRSVSWVNSVHRQFLPHGLSYGNCRLLTLLHVIAIPWFTVSSPLHHQWVIPFGSQCESPLICHTRREIKRREKCRYHPRFLESRIISPISSSLFILFHLNYYWIINLHKISLRIHIWNLISKWISKIMREMKSIKRDELELREFKSYLLVLEEVRRMEVTG